MKHFRLNGDEEIDVSVLERHIGDGAKVVVQFSQSGYSKKKLVLLNQLASSHGRNFEIRFYGHYFESFDASVLKHIPEARCLSIDCLTTAKNLENLAGLQKLEELSIGIFELDYPDILSYCTSANLKVLSIGPTRKSNIDLARVGDWQGLQALYVNGHSRNVSAVCKVLSLRSIGLESFGKSEPLEFLARVPNLKSLKLILGGRTSIDELDLPRLRELQIIRVKGLQTLGSLGRFKNLETFFIEDQLRLEEIKVGSNAKLFDIRILNCKGLRSVEGFRNLKAVSSLLVSRTAIDSDHFLAEGLPSSLKSISFFTGKRKRDDEIQTFLNAKGYQEYAWV
jgi:protein phosphatase 1 regulatory subunit 7